MKLISARSFAMTDGLFPHGIIFGCCCCWKSHSNSPFQAAAKNDLSDFMCGGQSHRAQLHGTFHSSPTCLWRRMPKILSLSLEAHPSLSYRESLWLTAQLCSWQDTCIYLWSKILESPNRLHIKSPHSTLSYQEKNDIKISICLVAHLLMISMLCLRDEIDMIYWCLELLRDSCSIICV